MNYFLKNKKIQPNFFSNTTKKTLQDYKKKIKTIFLIKYPHG